MLWQQTKNRIPLQQQQLYTSYWGYKVTAFLIPLGTNIVLVTFLQIALIKDFATTSACSIFSKWNNFVRANYICIFAHSRTSDAQYTLTREVCSLRQSNCGHIDQKKLSVLTLVFWSSGDRRWRSTEHRNDAYFTHNDSIYHLWPEWHISHFGAARWEIEASQERWLMDLELQKLIIVVSYNNMRDDELRARTRTLSRPYGHAPSWPSD